MEPASAQQPAAQAPQQASEGGAEGAAAGEPALEYASSCVIPTTWQRYPLVAVTPYNHDTSIFEFGLPPGQVRCLPHPTHASPQPERRRAPQSLSLPVCGCILMATNPAPDGSEEVRPYTPISDNGTCGKFQLLVKRYPAWGSPSFPHNYKPPGAVSNFIHGAPRPRPLR